MFYRIVRQSPECRQAVISIHPTMACAFEALDRISVEPHHRYARVARELAVADDQGRLVPREGVASPAGRV